MKLLKQVVDRLLHVGDALPGQVVAETPQEGADFAVELFLLHICKAIGGILLSNWFRKRRNVTV